MVQGRRGVEKRDGCEEELLRKQQESTYMLYTYPLLSTSLPGRKRHVQSCSLHQSSHCTKPRKPSRDSCEPGEDLAKASRTHFSVSDIVVIGCRHVELRLSGSILLGQSGFGRRNYRCGFACSGSVRMRVWLFAGADEFLIGCCRLFDGEQGRCLPVDEPIIEVDSAMYMHKSVHDTSNSNSFSFVTIPIY